ncbi:tRNA1(Val) (adenine(37)-N6)-methyltransferase [Afifella pfennigii]|uniref:tRNA1(Val) (adenine(37)-N6)-methyltransferase n=1 Tax=Afifella pfennigii TaxID=209897 RepID=UPI0005547E38|nr:methyltransferase [Afifella pfennigii]
MSRPRQPATHGFLGGRVELVRPASGHRPGLDAALLQAGVPAGARGLAVEFGCGTGAVALSLAARCPELSLLGLDLDEMAIAEAEAARGLAANAAFAGRVRFLRADVTDAALAERLAPERPSLVLANPPFYLHETASPSPDARRRLAHQAKREPLRDWIAAAARLLRKGGRLVLIHRADRLADILRHLAPRFGGVAVLPFHPREGEAASRVLVAASLAGRAPLKLLAGRVLHLPDGGWTAEIDEVLRGRADFALV